MRIARALVLCLLPSLARRNPSRSSTRSRRRRPHPTGALVEAPDGSFYGTSATGIYRRAPDGPVTLVARRRRRADGALRPRQRWRALRRHAVRRPNAAGTVFRFDPRHRRSAHAARVHRRQRRRETVRRPGRSRRTALRRRPAAVLRRLHAAGRSSTSIRRPARSPMLHAVQRLARDAGFGAEQPAAAGTGRHALWDDALRRRRQAGTHLPVRSGDRRVRRRPPDHRGRKASRRSGRCSSDSDGAVLRIGVRVAATARRHDLPLRPGDERSVQRAVLVHGATDGGTDPGRS